MLVRLGTWVDTPVESKTRKDNRRQGLRHAFLDYFFLEFAIPRFFPYGLTVGQDRPRPAVALVACAPEGQTWAWTSKGQSDGLGNGGMGVE